MEIIFLDFHFYYSASGGGRCRRVSNFQLHDSWASRYLLLMTLSKGFVTPITIRNEFSVTKAKIFYECFVTKTYTSTLFKNLNFCPKIQFRQKPQHFHEFFTQFFSWNQSCQQLRSPNPQHFHEFYTPKKIDNFLGKSKLNFWTKMKICESLIKISF